MPSVCGRICFKSSLIGPLKLIGTMKAGWNWMKVGQILTHHLVGALSILLEDMKLMRTLLPYNVKNTLEATYDQLSLLYLEER